MPYQNVIVLTIPIIETAIVEDWECLVCNESFSRRESAKDHFEGKHLKLYNYECQFCSKMFTCGSQRRAHIHLKHREENRLNKLPYFHR